MHWPGYWSIHQRSQLKRNGRKVLDYWTLPRYYCSRCCIPGWRTRRIPRYLSSRCCRSTRPTSGHPDSTFCTWSLGVQLHRRSDAVSKSVVNDLDNDLKCEEWFLAAAMPAFHQTSLFVVYNPTNCFGFRNRKISCYQICISWRGQWAGHLIQRSTDTLHAVSVTN